MAELGRANYYCHATVTKQPLFQSLAFIDYCRLCFKANHAIRVMREASSYRSIASLNSEKLSIFTIFRRQFFARAQEERPQGRQGVRLKRAD